MQEMKREEEEEVCVGGTFPNPFKIDVMPILHKRAQTVSALFNRFVFHFYPQFLSESAGLGVQGKMTFEHGRVNMGKFNS